MYEFRVNDKIYKIKFGYGVLYTSDLIDRVMNATTMSDDDAAGTMRNLIGLTAELLLAGLQKRHADEFGYETESERKEALKKVCDMIDDYEDENLDADGNHVKDGYTLFNELQEELVKNGFLSRIMAEAQGVAANQNATKIPRDHQKKKAGVR